MTDTTERTTAMMRPSRALRTAYRFLLALARHLGGDRAAHFIATASRGLTLAESATAARLLRGVRSVEAAEPETPETPESPETRRGEITFTNLIRRAGAPPTRGHQHVRAIGDSMKAAGIPAGSLCAVDPFRRAQAGDVVLAHVALSPLPDAANGVPFSVPVAMTLAHVRIHGDECWLEDADGLEIENLHYAFVQGVVVAVRPPPRAQARVINGVWEDLPAPYPDFVPPAPEDEVAGEEAEDGRP